jgi:hypothetical protein
MSTCHTRNPKSPKLVALPVRHNLSVIFGSLALFLIFEPSSEFCELFHAFCASLPIVRALHQFPITLFASPYQLNVARYSVLDPEPPHWALRVVAIDDLWQLHLD